MLKKTVYVVMNKENIPISRRRVHLGCLLVLSSNISAYICDRQEVRVVYKDMNSCVIKEL